MDIKQINTAIITGTFTNDQLSSIIDAVKFARSRIVQQARFTLRVGAEVKWNSSKTGMPETGKITKVAQKYATVKADSGMLWRVPMNMLETA